jgi:predicted amidohydrolase
MRLSVTSVCTITAAVLLYASGAVADSLATRPAEVKVAAVQCPSDLGAVEANRARLSALVEQAAANGAKIVVLPEAAITGYLSQDLGTNWRVPGRPIAAAFAGKDPSKFAESVPGPSTDQFCALAKRLKVYLTIPLLEVDGAGRYFNTVCLASPRGELVAHYRKLAPWPYPEDSWATPGDRGVQTFDTEYGRVGLAICYDIHTILEKYQPHHIWALLYSIAWVDANHPAEWFWHLLPRRIAAFDHYVIGANWSVDEPQPWFGYGFSTIYAPDGSILATSHSLFGADIVYATIKTQWTAR